MSALVRIPWQKHLFLTPSTLALLERASTYYGDDLYLYDAEYTRISPAWRSYAQQKAARNRWLAGQGPYASDPDTGQRNHMRGAAFDLRLTTARVQQACRRAGLVRDPGETWHWNDPAWASMPIIKTRVTLADLVTIPLPTAKDLEMRIIYDKEEKNDALRRIITGELTWSRITGPESQRERKLWGAPVNLSHGETVQAHVQVNKRRAQNGLPSVGF